MNDLQNHMLAQSDSSLAAAGGWTQRISVIVQRALRVPAANTRRMKRVETLTLGPRKAVHLIECDGHRFLLADGLSTPVVLPIDQGRVDR